MAFKKGDHVQFALKDPFGGDRISEGVVDGNLDDTYIVNTEMGLSMLVKDADIVSNTAQVAAGLKQSPSPTTYAEGYQAGYDSGYKEGYDTGYKVGDDSGSKTGYDAGYNDGLKASSQSATPTNTGVS